MIIIAAFPIFKFLYTSGEYIEMDNIAFAVDSGSDEPSDYEDEII
jgi:hypothetical protein